MAPRQIDDQLNGLSTLPMVFQDCMGYERPIDLHYLDAISLMTCSKPLVKISVFTEPSNEEYRLEDRQALT